MAISTPFLNGPPKKFGDPFLLPSTSSFPTDIRGTLDLCLYLYRINRLYGAAVGRLVSYFITDIEFLGEPNKNEKDDLRRALVEVMGVFSKMQQAGIEWAIYGNAFVRCIEPFDRWLIDDRNGRYQAIALETYPEHLVTYNYDRLTYTVPDLNAAKDLQKGKRNIERLPKVELQFRDKPSTAIDRFSIVFLDPRYVSLDKAHHSNSVQYVYTIPPDMENRIKSNILHEINNTPRGLLEAVAKNKDFRFHKGEVYHFKAPTPSGVSDSGWGCPEILLHYDTLYQIQVYRKADFAVAQDYLHPIRVFTPNFGGNMGDAVMTTVLSKWKSEMQKLIAAQRADGTSIHALPFKAEYSEYGGNGKMMVTHDLVEVHLNQLFDGLGIPRELFRGTLNPEQMPAAIAFFERTYEWLYEGLNGMLKFFASTLQRAIDTNEIEVRLKRPQTAYNAEWMRLKMQMAANREIPRSDVYPAVGISDPELSAVRAAMEDQEIERRTSELAVKFEKEKTQGSMADVAIMAAEQGAQAGAGQASGGAPGGPALDYAVDVGADPLQITQRAQEIATTWLQMHEQMPNSHRKEMQRAEAINPTLYAAAKQEMEKMRAQGASMGRAQAGQMAG